LRQKQRAIINT